MSIRIQTILALFPIFLGVGLIYGALSSVAEQRELMWGLREESLAYAGAIAAHLEGERWENLVSSPERFEHALSELDRRLPALQTGGRLKRITGFRAEDGRVVFELTPGTSAAAPEMVLAALKLDRETLGVVRGGRSVADLRTASDGRPMAFVAFAPIRGQDGAVVGTLGIETDPEPFLVAEREQRGRTNTMTAIVALFGIAAPWLIATLVRRRITALTAAATKVVAGESGVQVSPSGVQEIRELGSTFNTLVTVMEEVVEKAKNGLIEAEQCRSEADLRRTYLETFAPPKMVIGDRYSVGGRLANERSIEDFFSIVELSEKTICCVGKISETSSPADHSEEFLEAGAACSLWEEYLKIYTPEDAFERLREHFAIQCFECAVRNGADGVKRRWTYESSIGEVRDGSAGGSRIILHTLDAVAAERLEAYLACVPEAHPAQLANELAPLLVDANGGAVIIIGEGAA